MKIKFCGIRRLEDVAAVNLCQPDYMGMILSDGFRRSISQEQAQCLVQEKSDAIAAVGVFVNESSETICRMAEQLHLQGIQLHGNESAEQGLAEQVFVQTGSCSPATAGIVRFFWQVGCSRKMFWKQLQRFLPRAWIFPAALKRMA